MCLLLPACLALALSSPAAPADGEVRMPDDLCELSFAELLAIEVTTEPREAEPAAQSPAAVFVISRDDIRRSGATSIPELLRTAPGMHVARISSSLWAIGTRGEHSRFTDKLLVMIDGRPVRTILFSGILWVARDPVLADIERIELIRSPKGAVWGTSSVNGVINVITSSAADTPGSCGMARARNEEKGAVAHRHGGTVGEAGPRHAPARCAWPPADGHELSPVLQDARDPAHLEHGPGILATPLANERSHCVQPTRRG
jgi:iron complex outermembrane receptor protein